MSIKSDVKYKPKEVEIVGVSGNNVLTPTFSKNKKVLSVLSGNQLYLICLAKVFFCYT